MFLMTSLMLEACYRTKTKIETVYVPLDCPTEPVPAPTFEIANVEEECPAGMVCYNVIPFKLFVVWVVDLVQWAEEMEACVKRESDSE